VLEFPNLPGANVDTPSRTSQRVRFGEFELDLSTRELWINGTKQTLAPQPFQVLQLLIENQGQLVTRDALVRHLWTSDTFVDYEQGLKKAVNRLREALNDSAEQPHFIENLPRQGYRFIANVEFDNSHAHPEFPLARGVGSRNPRHSGNFVLARPCVAPRTASSW